MPLSGCGAQRSEFGTSVWRRRKPLTPRCGVGFEEWARAAEERTNHVLGRTLLSSGLASVTDLNIRMAETCFTALAAHLY
eukprot:1281119-Pleurochrysis_carterae.AAC.2